MEQSKKFVVLVIGVVVMGIGWFLFRPELLFVNQEVNEVLPVAAAEAEGASVKSLVQGEFITQAHHTEGQVEIVEVDGKRYLQLTGFETSNGPDLKVALVNGHDVSADKVTEQGYVNLGTLKGNLGDQSYEIPSDLDLDEYGVVSIWCERFGVGFGAAALS